MQTVDAGKIILNHNCRVGMSDPSKQSLSNSSPVSQNFAMMPSQMPSMNSMDRMQSLQDFSSLGLSNLSFQVPYMNAANMYVCQDNQFSLSRGSSLIKEEKDEVGSSGLHSQPTSAPGSGSSPKPFGAFSPGSDQEKSDKLGAFADLVIGLDKGMSPLSIVTVSLPDGGHPSPGSGSHQAALRYQPSRDAMLSAINYPDTVILQEGSFDVNVGGTLSSLEEGLIGNLGVTNTGTNTNSAFDFFDGDTGQDAYMDSANQDLQLSPQTFSNNPDAFNENSNLSGINDAGADNAGPTEDGKNTDLNKLTVDKARGKTRPTKATSPNRQGAQTCFQCGKVFSNSSALAKHKLTHSDERKYICQLCSKAFKRQDHLNGHMLTHRKKKPYECKVEGCGKSYCDARSLRRHTENHHSNTTNASVAVPTVTVLPQNLGLPPATLAGSIQFSDNKLDVNSYVSTNVTVSNRIQYAPPPASPYSSTSNSVSLSAATSVALPTAGEVTSSAVTGQLQIFAAFQQQDDSLLNWTTSQDQQQQQQHHQQQQQQQHQQQQQQQNQQQHLYLSQQVFSDPNPQSPQSVSDSYLPTQASTPGIDMTSPIHTPLSQHSDTGLLASSQSPSLRVGLPQLNADQSSMPQDQSSSLSSSNPIMTAELVIHSPQLPPPQSLSLQLQQTQQQTSRHSPQHHTQLQQRQQQHHQQQQQQSWNSQVTFNVPSSSSFVQEPKPVECPLCHRTFKNVPALNGHMRLHGGYFKKDNDPNKKSDKKADGSGHHPPLQTASMNVRALIEEKIIQRRIVNPQTSTQNTSSCQDLGPVQQQFSIPPLLDGIPGGSDQFSFSTDLLPMDLYQDWDLRTGLPCQQQLPSEKFRRHSDSDRFVAPRRPAANSALVDLLRRKGIMGKRTQRTGSDPGEPPMLPPVLMTSPGSAFTSSPGPQSPLRSPILQPATPTSIPSSPTTPTTPTAHTSSSRTFQDFCFETITSTGTIPALSPLVSSPQACVSSPTSSVAATTTTTLLVPKVEREDDDDVFLNPSSIPTSPMRAKKKHRPEPLYIPPHVNTNMNRFPSQLRSPRLWDPNVDGKTGSPPPYTPPPMLSPVRSGSGLFWHILSSGSLTPKSAPITPRFTMLHKSVSEPIPPEEEELGEAPETDIQPHVNIGPQFQAVLPQCRKNYVAEFSGFNNQKCKEDLVWHPDVESNLTEEEMDMFLEFACCAAVPGGGRNKEYALFILQMTNGNIQEALLRLMDPVPKLPKGHHLLTYHFQECDRWSPEEIEAYHQALHKCDKDFFAIAQELECKSVKQCVQFYYLWKKVCPEEYKRLRLIRRRREQENIMYNLRSKADMDGEIDAQHTPKSEGHPVSPSCLERDGNVSTTSGLDRYICDFPDCAASFVSKQGLNGHVRVHGGNGKPLNGSGLGRSPGHDTTDIAKAYSPLNSAANTLPTSLEVQEEFPCKICGKVFSKVKSRSAHMKSHRQGDTERRPNKYD